MKSHKTSIRVRYGETDQMGVVHHGNYALYLELARTDWLREFGASYKEMEASGVMLPVISMHLNYKKSAYYDEVIEVKTQLKNLSGVRIEFDYEITNQAGEVLVEANTVLAFVDMKTKRPMRAPQYIVDAISKG